MRKAVRTTKSGGAYPLIHKLSPRIVDNFGENPQGFNQNSLSVGIYRHFLHSLFCMPQLFIQLSTEFSTIGAKNRLVQLCTSLFLRFIRLLHPRYSQWPEQQPYRRFPDPSVSPLGHFCHRWRYPPHSSG